jgi:hypothetical protein
MDQTQTEGKRHGAMKSVTASTAPLPQPVDQGGVARQPNRGVRGGG